MLLSEYTSNRDNNFNLLRFMAALFVLYTHAFSLTTGQSSSEPLRVLLGMSLGDIAVDIFFITSGFLITSSYLNRGNMVAFAWARILRIYPGLIAAVLFCVFVVGLWFTSLSASEYLTHPQTYKYLIKNITLLGGVEHYLPGVFTDLPWKGVVNGSLWTLPFELKMYIILAIILFITLCIEKYIKLFSLKNVLLIAALLSIGLHIINVIDPFLYGNRERFIRLFSMFFVGAAFYVWKDYVVLSYKWFMLAVVLFLLSMLSKNFFIVIYSITLPYIIFYVAYVPSGFIRKFNTFGDYSYGMYIYAFPVLQLLVALDPHISVLAIILYSFIMTLILSIVSWHFIEKKFLKMKDNYRFIENIIKKSKLTIKCSDIK